MRRTPKPAVRKGAKARLLLDGPTGSGKTFSALSVGSVLADGGPVVVIDTERDSASLYADRWSYDSIDWTPPYDPRELAGEVKALASKYAVVIVDSLTHFWRGEGGTLDVVDAAAARAKGNSFAGWKEGTPAQNDMIEAMLGADAHIIATVRSKMAYVLEEDEKGRQVPRRVGLAPEQRQDIEYEFTLSADLDHEHNLIVDKSRCDLLAGKMFRAGHETDFAETLAGWLGSAAPLIDRADADALVTRMNDIGDDTARKEVKQAFANRFGRPDHLLASQVDEANEAVDVWMERLADIGGDDREDEPAVGEAPFSGDDHAVWPCEDCERTFESAGALGTHRSWHRRQEQLEDLPDEDIS